MIVGNVTLEQVDAIYQRMGIKELCVFPWYEDGQLVALVTGAIETDREDFPGERVGFLEHFIVLPEAKRKLEVMQLMPATLAEVARESGVDRLVLCIIDKDPRRHRLEKWARRCGWTPYGKSETRTWWQFPLKENG